MRGDVFGWLRLTKMGVGDGGGKCEGRVGYVSNELQRLPDLSPILQVCNMHGNFTSVSGKSGVSFSKHRCACDFRMHGHRFGLVYSTSQACTDSFRWWMDRDEPVIPITSSENSVLRPRTPPGGL